MAFIDTITVQDFKDYFYSDFKYGTVYNNTEIYNQGNTVFYGSTSYFYDCLQNNTTGILPTDSTKWLLRDNKVLLDFDIEKAFIEAKMTFKNVFPSNEKTKVAFLYLTAFFVCIDKNMGGINSSSIGGILSSKSVGNVSTSYTIPQWMTQGYWAMFTRNGYGYKYAMLVRPYTLVGTTFLIDKVVSPS